MPIINLSVKDKQASGDGTKIVCMNGDYFVRITTEDCEAFEDSAVQKLIVRYGLEYKEAEIQYIYEPSTGNYAEAKLPLIEHQTEVYLGVMGKDVDDPNVEPNFTSMPAKFECVKSVLCGALIAKGDPKLIDLEVTSNGTFTARDHDADGFYEVDVQVPMPAQESRTVELAMSGGDQTIEPTVSDRVMSKVVITKPLTLTPENIKKDVIIGGVKGIYEKKFTETEITLDGEYTPPEGFDGFSKIVVNVGKSNFEKLMHVGDTFTYDYDAAVQIKLDTAGIVSYMNDGNIITFTAIDLGSCVATIDDLDANGKVIRTTHYNITVSIEEDFTTPVEANSVDAMQEYLKKGVVGGVVKYTGTTGDGFVNGALYIIEEAE